LEASLEQKDLPPDKKTVELVQKACGEYVKATLGSDITIDFRKIRTLMIRNREKYGPPDKWAVGNTVGECLEQLAERGLLVRLTPLDKDRPNGGTLYKYIRAPEVLDAGNARIDVIPIEKIKPPKHMLRRSLGDLSGLMVSIRDEGLLDPILVRPVGDHYEVVDGHRRYQSICNLGTVKKVSCLVRQLDDRMAVLAGLVENIQKEDMTPLEIGEAIQLGVKNGWNKVQLSTRLGKSEDWIDSHLAILKYKEEIKMAIHLGKLSFVGARVLQRMIDKGQITEEAVMKLISIAYKKGLATTEVIEAAEKVAQSKEMISPEEAMEKVEKDAEQTRLGEHEGGVRVLANKSNTHFLCPNCKQEFDFDPKKKIVYWRQTKLSEFVVQKAF
jgi:ParB family chromosome partitioning protein